jgi:hypothetical protein
MKAPQRLLEDDSLSTRLRSDLVTARDHAADPNYDTASGLEALRASLKDTPPGGHDSDAPPAEGGTLGGAATSSGLSKLLLASGGVLAAGILAFLLWPDETASTRQTAGSHEVVRSTEVSGTDDVASRQPKASERQCSGPFQIENIMHIEIVACQNLSKHLIS